MRKKNTNSEWSKDLAGPLMLSFFGATFLLLGKNPLVGYWLMGFGIFFFWKVRKEITKLKIAEGIVFLGGYLLFVALATFTLPELGRYPSEREDSYPIFVAAFAFASFGYALRNIIIKKLNKACQATSASARRLHLSFGN
ncbi:hypothetical protein IEN85_10550 [Pelagicoccus sp. NFK12]|uniref:Uncharacterized protein n=2 Tax=Pelagicoccus enzymogenes TaxID=2773457 RepID=A0A927FAK5_9BACT|nr:hypothetical protein [Pelagicoccus enzymogenes]